MSGTAQQYCLRWNNYQNNLTNVFNLLLESEAFVDVTIACDGQSLKCHKMVLSACSPFFKNLFFDNPCTHPIVILKDIRWEELKAVVEFMYRGEINVSQEQLAPLLNVAEVLKIRGLADVSRSNNSDYVPTSSLQHHYPQQNLQTESDNDGNGSKTHTPNGSGNSSNLNMASHMTASLRRKRRKISTPNRTPSPADTMDDQSSQNEIENNAEEYDHSPVLSFGKCDSSGLAGVSGNSNCSVNTTPPSTIANSMNPITTGTGCQSSVPLPPAAAAVAAASFGGSMGSSSLLNLHNATNAALSSVSNELDLKPGIVEMIREEERAKMLESSHGWLGPSASSLSESYQYQIQSLWQKCWNTNQTGMVHALRFRERGPLKSWRPETMAEAIFAVLREGLSLSQAARKYDIPYPTFVLYANRVHNMLGPSADGCSGTDLITDMRPKGRGRPQRILLGTWPEDHIRGVIRAVVFRETGGKDEVPFLYNRDASVCVPSQAGTSHNGLDMSLHQSFGGGSGGGGGGGNGNGVLFINPQSSQQQQHSQLLNPSVACSSVTTTDDLQAQRGTTSPTSSTSLTPAQLQQLAEEQQAAHASSRQQSNSSRTNSPLQNISNALTSPSQQLRSSLQQQHRQLQQMQQQLNESSSSSSVLPHLNFKDRVSNSDDVVLNSNPEIIQIKAEIPFDDMDDEDVPDDMSNSDDEGMEDQAVRVIASAVAAAAANTVVVSPPSSVSNLTISPTPVDRKSSSSANLMVHSDGNSYLSDNEINTPPPHFQTS